MKVQRQSANCLNGGRVRSVTVRQTQRKSMYLAAVFPFSLSFVLSFSVFFFSFLTLSFVRSFVCLIHSNSKCDSRACPYLYPCLVMKWLLIEPMENKKNKNKQTKEKNETINLPITQIFFLQKTVMKYLSFLICSKCV